MKRERNALAQHVAAVQLPLLKEAGDTFSEPELAALRGLIRLDVEFGAFITDADSEILEPDDVDYLTGSILAGVDSFYAVSKAYAVLVGAAETRVRWAEVAALKSPSALREHYMALYANLERRGEFETKCAALLDLFKLQLAFVVASYNWTIRG